MNQKDRKVVGDYLRSCADAMELRDWHIDYSREELDADGDAAADVDVLYGRKRARIRLRAGFKDLPREDQRHIVAHELVHCHVEVLLDMARNDLEQLLGKPADHVFWLSYKRQLELAVDGLTTAIAKHLPLIEWS